MPTPQTAPAPDPAGLPAATGLPDGAGHPRRWWALAVLVLSLLIVVLDNTVLNVALERISRPAPDGLAASQAQLQWAVNSYTLVFAGMLFTWGVLGDRVGRRRILLIGFVLFGIASLLSAYSQDPEQLIAARAFMGLGGAAVMPSTMSIIVNIFDDRERFRAIGIWAGAVGMAIAIGPVVGGLLLDRFWWGSVFLINVPIVVLGLVLIVLVVPESRAARPGRLDPLGVALQTLGLVSLVYGIVRIGDLGTAADWTVVVPVLAGVGVLALFVRHELRAENPVLDVRLFRERRFSAAVAAIALTFFALLGVTFFMVFYLQVVRGLTPLQAGLWLLPLAGGQLVASVQSAQVTARFGPRATASAGLALIAVAFLCFLGLDETSPLWQLGGLFVLQGLGMGTAVPVASNTVIAAMPRDKAGSASAMNNTARQLGGALGVAVLGTLLSAVYRRGVAEDLARLPMPESVRHAAESSVQATQALIDRIGPQAAPLRAPAYEAFLTAMHVTALGSAAVAVVGLVVVARFFPGRPSRPGALRAEEQETVTTAGVA